MKRILSVSLLFSVAFAFLLSAGCSLAPEYKRPEISVPEKWPEGKSYQKTAAEKDTSSASEIPWQSFFLNEKLRQVIGLALSNNRNLRVAALNIEKTRALYRIQRAGHLPSVVGQAYGTSQRVPETLSTTGKTYIGRRYDLNVGILSYELDFFGRVKSLKAAALEQYLATEQAKASAQISLIGEVTGAWLSLAADKERLQLAADTFEAQKSSYGIIKRRFEAGASSELALRQAETRMKAAKVDMVRFTSRVAQDQNILNLIAGTTVPEQLLPESLAAIDRDDNVIVTPAAGLPSTVLLNRPDILAAERSLMAANAQIGAARAAFFPSITLTGTFGVASNEVSTLFDQGAVWSFMPKLTIPIFTGGRNRANLKVSKIERDIAVAKYEMAIQNAFREVADALAQNGTVNDQIEAQTALLKASSESFRLSDLRYQKGIDSYLNVLDAQRSLYSSQQAMINTRLLKLSSRIALYKALGGGIN